MNVVRIEIELDEEHTMLSAVLPLDATYTDVSECLSSLFERVQASIRK